MPGHIGCFAVKPSQQPDRQIKNVDALLLLQSLSVIPDVEESLLEALGCQAGLELVLSLIHI